MGNVITCNNAPYLPSSKCLLVAEAYLIIAYAFCGDVPVDAAQHGTCDCRCWPSQRLQHIKV